MVTAEAARTRPEVGVDETVPNVLAIVVTHRGRAWLKDCLVALNTQTYGSLDVMVVDDASPDFRQQPHLKRVTKRHLRRRRWAYLRTPRPLGFGGAINWALSRVRTKAHLLLFIHDDAALDPGAVERMVARAVADQTTAIVGPKVVSWDDPTRLEEVGMAADRFGYPYKGLEEGEIDLGQHDVAAEVFFVSSTCMLVRHDVFRQLQGFDARMRAFAEDLDLCWRAHIAGYSVRVEPMAQARHAIALAKGERVSPFRPIRYFIRRNRLRAVTKNVSTLRLLGLIPQFVLLALAEMVGFIILRQPREILNLARALGWNLITFPQTLGERARAQRQRKVADRSMRRFTIRQSTRLRAYIGHQGERLEEVWGRRAEILTRGSAQARDVTGKIRGLPGVVVAIALIGFLIGFRHFLWAPPASVGELLPFPENATALLRAFLSPWYGAGLGQAGPGPPALALLGMVQLLFGGAAQKVLVLGLGAIAFVGAYRLVAGLVDRPARYATGVAYSVGAVAYAGIRGGHLGALVFGAAAPFVVLFLIRQTAWVRPAGWDRGRGIARITLGAAVSAAFVPGSLLLYLIVAIVLAGARAVMERSQEAVRGLAASTIGLIAGWALLLPWSATWFSEGGPLHSLMGSETRAVFAAAFAGHGMLSVVLGQMPDIPVLFGLSLPLFGALALALGEGQRRRLAIAFWTLIVTLGAIVTLIATGAIPPIVASPVEGGVLVALSFSALVGLAVGSFRLDLPRRGLGLIHALALSGVAVAAFLVAAGIVPALLRGDWGVGRGSDRQDAQVVAQINSLLHAEVQETGAFRALWVGEGWTAPAPSAARRLGDHFVTGARGQALPDLFQRGGPGYAELARVVGAVESGSTDRGGVLLSVFNVHYVVVERGPRASTWLRQLDIAVIRDAPTYLLMENQYRLPRAALYEDVPPSVQAVLTGEVALTGSPAPGATTEAEQRSSSRYVAEDVSGPGVVFLAEANDPRWQATLDDESLRHEATVWGNLFEAPSTSGNLTIRYPYGNGRILWLVLVGLGWIVVIGAAASRARAAREWL